MLDKNESRFIGAVVIDKNSFGPICPESDLEMTVMDDCPKSINKTMEHHTGI